MIICDICKRPVEYNYSNFTVVERKKDLRLSVMVVKNTTKHEMTVCLDCVKKLVFDISENITGTEKLRIDYSSVFYNKLLDFIKWF